MSFLKSFSIQSLITQLIASFYIRITPADMEKLHFFISLAEPIHLATQLRQGWVIDFLFFIDLLYGKFAV